jgi:hypothetical protein
MLDLLGQDVDLIVLARYMLGSDFRRPILVAYDQLLRTLHAHQVPARVS